jgi:hypothetical protein
VISLYAGLDGFRAHRLPNIVARAGREISPSLKLAVLESQSLEIDLRLPTFLRAS